MNTVRAMTQTAVMLTTVVALVACSGGKTSVKSDLHIKGAPNWVNKGSKVLKDKNGRLFHGVGMAAEMGNMSLQKSTADNRARAEIARILSSYMDIVSKDYVTSNRVNGQAVSEEQVSREIKNITETNLAGVRIVGRWRHKKSSTIYSLAELDMKDVKQTVSTYREMNAGLRGYFDRNADNIFDKVVEETR
ncbi:MAG: LPP20 family lipoprotein [Acidiferrobacterales bacterium]